MLPRSSRFTLILAVLGVICLFLPAHAQERTTGAGAVPGAATMGFAGSAGQQSLGNALRANVSSTAGNMNESCTEGGNTYTHGQTWTATCPSGSAGMVTKICLHGQNAIQSDSCKSALPCGSHPSSTSWTAACPSGTSGNMTYTCQDGNIVVDTSAFNNCTVPKCAGSNGSIACPNTVDGILMSGTMSYTCSNDTLSFTGNNCSTYNKPCGGTPHGGQTAYACGTYNGNLNGNFYMYCNNGYNYVSSLQCYPKTWHYFDVYLSQSCNTGQVGYYETQDARCQVNFNLRERLASKGGVPNGVPLTGVVIRIPYGGAGLYGIYNYGSWGNFTTLARRTYGLDSANYYVADYGNEGDVYSGWYPSYCTGTLQSRPKSNSGYFIFDGNNVYLEAAFITAGAEISGRHYHQDCTGAAQINTNGNMEITGYAYY